MNVLAVEEAARNFEKSGLGRSPNPDREGNRPKTDSCVVNPGLSRTVGLLIPDGSEYKHDRRR
jgi:hypothetical protein